MLALAAQTDVRIGALIVLATAVVMILWGQSKPRTP
jgi:hypothetical protein